MRKRTLKTKRNEKRKRLKKTKKTTKSLALVIVLQMRFIRTFSMGNLTNLEHNFQNETFFCREKKDMKNQNFPDAVRVLLFNLKCIDRTFFFGYHSDDTMCVCVWYSQYGFQCDVVCDRSSFFWYFFEPHISMVYLYFTKSFFLTQISCSDVEGCFRPQHKVLKKREKNVFDTQSSLMSSAVYFSFIINN